MFEGKLFVLSTWWCFFLEHTKVLMKQAKARIDAQRWFVGADQALIPWFSALLVLGAVFACSGSIFLFFCWCYSREVMKRCLWLQMVVWRRRTNQICYYRFPKIYHVLCIGICCIFSIHIISVAEKDFHDVNPNFLVPSYSLSQCRVIRQHLIWSMNSKHMVVVDINKVWFPFGLAMPVDWIHHCWHISIADETNIPFIFPLSDRNVTNGHENHFTI